MKNLDFDWLTDEFMLYCRSTQLREKTMSSPRRDTPPGVSVSVSIAYQKKREKNETCNSFGSMLAKATH